MVKTQSSVRRLSTSFWWFTCLFAVLALGLSPQIAEAQFNRTARTGGTTGSTLGASAMRSAASQGPFGTRTFGQGMSARTGTSTGLGLSSTLSSRTTQQQMRQAGRQQGQFVGADTGDIRNLLGFITNPQQAMQAWRQGLTAIRSGNVQQPTQPGSTRFGAGTGRGGTRSTEVPSVLQPGFVVESPPVSNLAESLGSRLDKAGLTGAGRSVEVTIEGGVVVLRGQVETPYQRLVAENLARLEPGVREVRNELVVRESSTPSETR
jgi:hypothetical protein